MGRTDSTTLLGQALSAARSQARERYGDAYVPDAPRRYERKVKNAQEAHINIERASELLADRRAAGPSTRKKKAAKKKAPAKKKAVPRSPPAKKKATAKKAGTTPGAGTTGGAADADAVAMRAASTEPF